MGSESESGAEGNGESMADFSGEEDETPEDPSRLENLHEITPLLPSAMRLSKGAPEKDPNEGRALNELCVEDLIPTVTNPKLIANNGSLKSSKSGVQGRLSAPLAERPQDKLDRATAYERSRKRRSVAGTSEI